MNKGILTKFICMQDLSEPKYEYLIKNHQNSGIKHLHDSKAFIECSNTVDDVYENINDYNPSSERKILIVFDDMTADIMTSKIFQEIIKELSIRCTILNISLVFISQSYFSVLKDVTLNSTHLIMKNNNKRDLENVAIDHSTDIDYKDFVKNLQRMHKRIF